MARFRRRKRTVAWLPQVWQYDTYPDVGYWREGMVVDSVPNNIRTTIFAMVPDYPSEAIQSPTLPQSLSDYEGSGYRLRRIVGKFFGAASQDVGADQGPTYPRVFMAGLGFMVLRVDATTGSPLNATANNYNVFSARNTRDPWIWRRTWVLSNQFAWFSATALAAYAGFPVCTSEYGSALDGGHFDAKTARTVKTEERLFAIVSTMNLDPSASVDTNGIFNWFMEYRVLATPIRVMGNRRNASR